MGEKVLDRRLVEEKLLQKNNYARVNGLHVESISRQEIVVTAELTDTVKNLYGRVHGGMLFLMADSAAGILARADGRRYVTLNADIHFLRTADHGKLSAHGTVVRRGHTTCVVDMEILDEDGQLLAKSTVTMYCTTPDSTEFLDELTASVLEGEGTAEAEAAEE